MRFTYADCVRLMPEWNGLALEIRELKGGITNQLYRVTSGDGIDCVFRFYGKKTELFIDRDGEMENLRRLASSGITPRLLKYLPAEGVTVVEFIPGYVLKNQDFLKEELWEKIISPIRMVHQSGIRLPLLFNPVVEVRRLYRVLEGIKTRYPEFDIPAVIEVIEEIGEFPDVLTSEYVACHNDLLADNFVLTEAGGSYRSPMCLIDWEYGGMAPPPLRFGRYAPGDSAPEAGGKETPEHLLSGQGSRPSSVHDRSVQAFSGYLLVFVESDSVEHLRYRF